MPAIPRRGRAPGYWAPRAYCVLSQSGVIPGIVELLKDKLYLNGRRAALWLPVSSDTPGVVQCTCYKNATQRSDSRCLTCVSGATRVYVRGRGLIRVDDLVHGGPFEVWSGKAWRRAVAWQTGVRETYEVETNWGLKLRATADHQVLTADGEWVEVSNLPIGARLDFAPPDQAFATEPVAISGKIVQAKSGVDYNFPAYDSYDVGLFLGYILGDGSVTNRRFPTVQIAMSARDREDVENLNRIVRSWCTTKTEVFTRERIATGDLVRPKSPEPLATAHWRIRGLADFLRNLGLDKSSAIELRRVPTHVMHGSAECVRGFLSGLISTDGSVGVSGRRIEVSLASVAIRMLQDVQLLLAGFGVRSTIAPYTTRNENTKHRPLYKLSISALKSVENFAQNVGIFNRRKREKLSEALIVRKALFGARGSSKKSPKVVCVKRTGLHEPVYDLSVEGDHQFVADGVTVHNCYGTQYAPGYLKFLHETIWFASAQYQTLTLTNTVISTTIKPYRIVLSPGALTGTIVTPDATWTNPQNADWTFDLAAFREMATDDFNVEFSKDAGVTWFDIADINGPPKPIGATGTIRFRVTLSRVASTTQSPEFEILRLRRPMPEFVPVEMRQQRPDLPAGEILILRTWEQEQVLRNIVAGRQVNLEADGGWTTPLNTFDTRIDADTPPARIDDRQAGPHPFYEQREGIHTGQRDVMTQIRFNENLRVFTHQSFSTRKAQQGTIVAGTIAGEVYNLVF